MLALQADLAAAIAQRRSTCGSPRTSNPASRARRRVNPEAHDAYLLGRYFFNRPSDENLQKAIDAVREIREAESRRSPPAYSGLSDAYLWAGYNEGFLTASKARSSRRQAARAGRAARQHVRGSARVARHVHAVLRQGLAGLRAGVSQGDRAQSRTTPSRTTSSGWRSVSSGASTKPIAEGKRAAELDPLSPQILIDASMPYLYRKDTVSAIQLARRAASSIRRTSFLS